MSNENRRRRILLPVKKSGSIDPKDEAYWSSMEKLSERHRSLCASTYGCVRPANGTGGIDLCMHCEDDSMNYLQEKGGPWGGPGGGGVFRSAQQAALSGIDEETYNKWMAMASKQATLEESKSGLAFVRKCGNGSCIRSGETATRKYEAPSRCLPCQENSDNKLTL